MCLGVSKVSTGARIVKNQIVTWKKLILLKNVDDYLDDFTS